MSTHCSLNTLDIWISSDLLSVDNIDFTSCIEHQKNEPQNTWKATVEGDDGHVTNFEVNNAIPEYSPSRAQVH